MNILIKKIIAITSSSPKSKDILNIDMLDYRNANIKQKTLKAKFSKHNYRKINLSSINFSTWGIEEMMSFRKQPTCKEIILRGSYISLSVISVLMEKLPACEKIDLSSINLVHETVRGIQKFCETIRACKEINITGIDLSDDALTALRKELPNCKIIERSELNILKPIKNDSLLKIKEERVLDLSNTNTHPKALKRKLYDYDYIKINLSGIDLTNWTAEDIQKKYTILYGCEEFDVSNTKISRKAISALMRILPQCKKINLSGINLSTWTAEEIQKKCPTLYGCEELDLNNTNISQEAKRALIKKLPKMK